MILETHHDSTYDKFNLNGLNTTTKIGEGHGKNANSNIKTGGLSSRYPKIRTILDTV
jgi:hypothetical protein